jgi:hypothetical protein
LYDNASLRQRTFRLDHVEDSLEGILEDEKLLQFGRRLGQVVQQD